MVWKHENTACTEEEKKKKKLGSAVLLLLAFPGVESSLNFPCNALGVQSNLLYCNLLYSSKKTARTHLS